MEKYIYILSISLQVSGALLLMLFSLSTRRKQVVKRFISKNLVIRDSNEKLTYDVKELKNTFRIAYLNKFSFGFIAMGYLLGIYGDLNNANLLCVTIWVILGSLLLMAIAYILTSLILKFSKIAQRTLTEMELKQYDLEPNISMITPAEFEEEWRKA